MGVWKTVLLALLALVILSDSADARRRMRLPIFVPIPGASSGGSIVKVLDLPDSALTRRADGRYVDLGYRFIGGSGGEWVGYVGSSRSYLPLSPSALQGLMLVAGLKELPPVPQRPSSSGGGMFMLLAAAAILGFGLLKKVGSGLARTAVNASSAFDRGSATPDWVAKAEQRVAAGNYTPATAVAPRRPSVTTPSSYNPNAGARAAFGRRA